MISDSLRRVVVEGVLPQVDCGRFPIKRALGETVAVTADIHADGHDALAAVTMYRRAGEDAWREVPMEATGNDRWQAGFTVDALGDVRVHRRRLDRPFGSWRSELSKKFGAGQDVASELLEGAALIRETVARLQPMVAATGQRPAGSDSKAVTLLADRAATLEAIATAQGERVVQALSEELHRLMDAHPDRSRATRFDRVLGVIVERERARVRRVVRDVSAVGGHRPVAQRHVRRGGRAAALRRGDGLRRPLPAADPSDRPQLPQGTATTR